MHLKVPVRDKPGEVLIANPKPPLAAVVRGAGKKIRVRTIRHSYWWKRATTSLMRKSRSF